jgi:hypothetical protein
MDYVKHLIREHLHGIATKEKLLAQAEARCNRSRIAADSRLEIRWREQMLKEARDEEFEVEGETKFFCG